jgi:hypothetical protein
VAEETAFTLEGLMSDHVAEATQRQYEFVLCLLREMAKAKFEVIRTEELQKMFPFYLFFLAARGVKSLEFDYDSFREHTPYPQLSAALSDARLGGYLYHKEPSFSSDDRNFFEDSAARRIDHYFEKHGTLDNDERVAALAASAFVIFTRRSGVDDFERCVDDTGYKS